MLWNRLTALYLKLKTGHSRDEYLTLSTIHSAKGLEWKAVFIIGAVDGRFPSVYSFNSEEELDEELRLMYVAATRAKSYLYITYPIDMFDHAYRHGFVQAVKIFGRNTRRHSRALGA